MLTSTFEPRGEMANRTRVLKWVFPTGATLTVGGVFLYALVERLSFGPTDGWWYATLSQCFLPSLLLGTVLAIVGSFIDRKRLSVAQARVRGVICWLVSGVSVLLLHSFGNIHGWTFTFIFPAFVGLVAGAALLSKLTNDSPSYS